MAPTQKAFLSARLVRVALCRHQLGSFPGLSSPLSHLSPLSRRWESNCWTPTFHGHLVLTALHHFVGLFGFYDESLGH